MTWIKAGDPLALLAIQAGQTSNPSTQEGAAASSPLNVDQRSIDLGEPVPIVFARRRNDAGGILISPGASEARFENDASNNVTAFYLLVLSEGELDSIPVKDILQGACRVGSHTQTYNRRAGTWLPGNDIVERDGYDKPEASYICGSVGLYPNMTTLSFQYTVPDGFDYWRRQVHVFIRGGMYVTRLLDSVFGSSDNFADLVHWMLANNGRVPTALIDTTALTTAALFLEANSFACNCWLQEARNYSDMLTQWSPYFLLGESSANGKKGLRPLLPINADGTLNVSTITPEYTFTEADILPGTLEINYTSWSDRQPFVAQMTWRQELGTEPAIIRTAEVQMIGTAESGPYESHDLSAFCTSENHAVKAGAYILARRVHVSHTVRFSARPQAHNTILEPGSIVRVILQRTVSGGGPSTHDYFYQVERVTKTLAGDVSYECSHFPIDTQQRSIVSQLVASAVGSGIVLTGNTTGVGCDVNSATDNTIPAETYTIPSDADYAGSSTTLDDRSYGDYGGNGGSGVTENPADNYDINNFLPLGGLLSNGKSLVSNPLTANSQCALQWYRDGVAISGATGNTYTPTAQDLGAQISVIDNCGGSSGSAQVVGYDPKFSLNGGIKANVTIRRIIQTYWQTNCSTNTIQPTIEDISTTFYLQFTQIKTYTADAGGGASLPNTMSYSIACNAGTGTNYRINGGYQVLTPGGSFVNNGYWGNNITLSANQGLTSFHSTIITSIVLTEANAAYGNIGDNVLDLGILEAVSSGASFWTKGTVIT